MQNYVSSVQVVQRKRDSRTPSEVLAGDSVTLSEVSVVSPENLLSMDTATIIDVNFLGLFPKSLLAVLRKYKQNLEKDRHPGFDELINNLILHLSIGQS